MQQRNVFTGFMHPFRTHALPFHVFVRALQYMHHDANVNSMLKLPYAAYPSSVHRRVMLGMLLLVKYLASTFLGMVAVARGDLEGADRCYADALRLFPGAHAAMIGRSEAAYLRGRSAEAAEIVISLLEQERKDDPWWLYLAGDWWHFEARLLGLRTEVRR